MNKNSVFSANDHVVIKVLGEEKGYSAKNSSQNFPASHRHLNKLLQKTDTDVTIERKHSSGWKRTVSKNEEFSDETVKQLQTHL